MTHLTGWIRSGAISAERLAGLYLDRLARLGPQLECVAAITADLAMSQAQRADALLARGTWLGPLHGVPWGAKDLLDTAGIATGWGAEPYADRVPEGDAAVVCRLAEAGAVLVAKLSLGALAYGKPVAGDRYRRWVGSTSLSCRAPGWLTRRGRCGRGRCWTVRFRRRSLTFRRCTRAGAGTTGRAPPSPMSDRHNCPPFTALPQARRGCRAGPLGTGAGDGASRARPRLARAQCPHAHRHGPRRTSSRPCERSRRTVASAAASRRR